MEFTIQLARAGFHIVLLARREPRLQQQAADLSHRYGVATRVLAVDLAQQDFLPKIVEATADISVGLLVNCAGFALTSAFIDAGLDDTLDLIRVNCIAPVATSYHFGRLMAQRGKGGIINVSSAASFLPVPNWSTYAASKAFVRYFSEAIWHELRSKHVDVLMLCPGSTDTEFSKIAGVAMAGMPVSPVVERALKSIGKKPGVVVGLANWLATTLTRLVSRRGNIWLGSMMIPVPDPSHLSPSQSGEK